jgi:thiamine-phosphate pyrophosphorylase
VTTGVMGNMAVDTRAEPLDLRCYLVTSGTDRRTVEVAAAAAAAGAGVVQVRAKEASAAELLELTLAVAGAVRAARPATRVLVDDRPDVAFAARERGAAVHGVHLGQDDLPVADARALLGPGAVIGLTTGTLDLVRRAEAQRDLLDYIGAGPFRPTPTKDSGRPPLGVDGYRELAAATALPIVAIGDVTAADTPALAATGVAGVALVRALMGAPDPAGVVREVLAGFAGIPGGAGAGRAD